MTGLKPAMLHRLQSPPSFGSDVPCTPLYPSTRLLAGPQPHSTHLQQDNGLLSLLSFSSSIGVISCSFLPGNCSKATFSKKFTRAPIWASPYQSFCISSLWSLTITQPIWDGLLIHHVCLLEPKFHEDWQLCLPVYSFLLGT